MDLPPRRKKFQVMMPEKISFTKRKKVPQKNEKKMKTAKYQGTFRIRSGLFCCVTSFTINGDAMNPKVIYLYSYHTHRKSSRTSKVVVYLFLECCFFSILAKFYTIYILLLISNLWKHFVHGLPLLLCTTKHH